MNIKFKKFLLLFVILIVSIGAIVFCGSSCFESWYISISDIVKSLEKWGVELPEDCELLFYESDVAFTDGEYYYIVGFEEEPAELIKDFSYKRNESDEEYLDKITRRILSEEQEADYLPDWEANHCYSGELKNEHNDRLYMLYYPKNTELFIVIIDY